MDEPHQIPAFAGEGKWLAVCRLDRLVLRKMLCTQVKGIDLILIWSDGRAVACERVCPHEQADLSLGHVSDGRLFCPRHAATFDLCDGRISEGWSSRPLRIYPVRIEDDQVWVDAHAINLPEA